MNFTGGNTLPNIGRRLSWQFAILVGGLGIAISAGALAGAFERGASPATTAVTQPAPSVSSPPTTAGNITGVTSGAVYYLVGSEAEARTLQSLISTEAAAYPSDVTPHVVVAGSAEQTADAYATITLATAELTSLGVETSVIDLRQPAPSPSIATGVSVGQPAHVILYVVGSQTEAVALRQQFHEAGNEAPGNVLREVLVVDSTVSEEMLATASGEQMATGGFEIIDLRD